MNRHAELLLCHATGTAHWDIPKGVGEPGESPQQAALRETDEETGLRLEPGRLLELGRFAYRRDKDLHLFACLVERVDTATLVCSSRFVDRRGRSVPEADAFEWTPFDRVGERCAKRMAALLTNELSLGELLAQLQR